jgi:hypothetical protein
MRKIWFLLSFVLISTACLHRDNFTSDLQNNESVQQGFPLTLENLPFDSSYTQAVAKLYRGNSFVASGAFISENGLFITTYDPVLNLVSTNPEQKSILAGYSAESSDSEIPISGMSLLVLIEERDVTQLFEEQIPDDLNNAQISRVKQRISQSIVNAESQGRSDVYVQLSEILSGNRQILSVYKILNDLRLVWAEGIADSAQPFADSNELFEQASSKTSVIRAYVQPDGRSAGFQESNIPFQPKAHFSFPSNDQNDQLAFMLGFPERTFRLDTYRAFTFYNTVTNPSIINAYEAYQKRLDVSAASNPDFAYGTMYDRFNTAIQVNQYNAIQNEFEEKDILDLKSVEEFDLRLWLQNDSTGNSSYRDIFTFIDQAYDILEQNGASFFVTSYALRLGRLDDVANLIKQYYEESALAQTDEEIQLLRQQVLQSQQQILSTLDIDSELRFLSDLLVLFDDLPEDQTILAVEALFEDVPTTDRQSIAQAFLERQVTNTFLFDVATTQSAIENDTVYNDSLFTLLDEILFVNDLNRNDYAIYLAYQQPAQQILVQAIRSREGHIFPDANGTLRVNRGFYKLALNKRPSEYILTYNDFAARAPGSVVINQAGEILGIADHHVSENLITNYLYQKENAYFYSLDARSILDKLLETDSEWKSELTY